MKKIIVFTILTVVLGCNSLIEQRSTVDSADGDDFISEPAKVAGSLYSTIRNKCDVSKTSETQFQIDCHTMSEKKDKATLVAVESLPKEIEIAWIKPRMLSGKLSSVTCSQANFTHPSAPLRQVCIAIASAPGLKLTDAKDIVVQMDMKVSLVSYRSETPVNPTPSVSPVASPSPSSSPSPGPGASSAPMALTSLVEKVLNNSRVETQIVNIK